MKLLDIKNLIRDWFGAVSVDEITSNKNLSQIFESIETCFSILEREDVLWI